MIELKNVSKWYGSFQVLTDCSTNIQKGEVVVVCGPSGSGKSTLMNILGCLDRPSEGSYHFQGQDVATLDSDALAWLRREAFGFVFQGYHLIASESASENVEMPAIYAGL
ncbi:ABC transporter ATP-binding protein, partial [Bacillus cereus group sp. TH253LC]